MRRALTTLLVLAVLLLAACNPVMQDGKNETPTGKVVDDSTAKKETKAVEKPNEEPKKETTTPEPDEDLPTKTVTEGELVSFPNLKATDPDGDPITYVFASPLDESGEWQTAAGDAGRYIVTITASDGKNQVSQDVLIIVTALNSAPVLELADSIKVKEGQTVDLEVTTSDADGDDVTVTFSGWMTGPSKTTTFADAGDHEVTVTATDGKETVSKKVTVMVENVNRAPKLNPIKDVTVKEGDKITLSPIAEDADNDALTFTYSKPIGPEGVWKTKDGDVGKYRINVTVSDSEATDSVSFFLIVESLNKAPTIDVAEAISVNEGSTVSLDAKISDPENDELTISYSGWMSSSSYQTDYDDAGEHKVTITVSDGINEVEKTVTVTVHEVNRPPTFDSSSFI